MGIIEINKLTHTLPNGRIVLDDISLSIERGAFVVLAGPNGSGKTTLLRHLNALLAPTSGSVTVDGVSACDDPLRARTKIGMVFQDADSQIVGETVYEDAAFGPENLCWSSDRIKQAVDKAIRTVGLEELAFQSPHLLSGGEKRRLAIAGVLAMGPEVLVFDEPFANLDYAGVRQVLTHIVELHATGHTVIISAHDLEKVVAHAQRLIVLSSGRIVEDGSPMNILHRVETYGIRQPCSVRMGGSLDSWLD